MTIIKPEDILETYGSFNDLTVGGTTPIASRRTLTTTEALSSVLESYYTPDVLKGKSVYDGVVLACIPTTSPNIQSNQKLIEYLAEATEDRVFQLYYVYKVLVPEVDPRPIHFSGKNRPAGGLTNAQRVMTLPSAIIDLSVEGAESAEIRLIQPGTYVQIIYNNQEKLNIPKVVGIGKKIIEVAGKLNTGTTLATTFARNGHTARANPGEWGSTPAQQAMVQLAKDQKDLRREIFEDTTDKWKDARGGLGPFTKKSGRKWTSNAILNLTHQQALKEKYQWKINDVAKTLGMEVKTLEKIFKKESGTFDPYAINHSTGATGLIQFMPEISSANTAGELGTTARELLTMGPEKQLDYVLEYFQNQKRGKTMKEEVDWYFIVFYPAAIGKSDDYVIGNASTAEVNSGYADPEHPQRLITRRQVKKRWMA